MKRVLIIRIFFILTIPLLSGCVILPLPPSYTGDSRQNIDSKSKEKIVPGKTYIEDIILEYGEPDVVSPDGNKLVYGIQKNVGVLLWGIGAPAAGGFGGAAPLETDYYLIIHIDKNGLVKEVDFNIDDWNWNLPEELKPKSYNIPPHKNYSRLYPNISLPQEIDLAMVTVTDNRKSQRHYLDAVLIPSETELLRRVLVQKLTDLQRSYGIESPQNYYVNLNEFLIDYKLVLFEVKIKVMVKYENIEKTLSAIHQIKAPFWRVKNQEQAITTAIESAFDDLKEKLKLMAPELFDSQK